MRKQSVPSKQISGVGAKGPDLWANRECGPVVPDIGNDWLEKGVIAGFRVWQLIFMSGAGATVIIVVMCCFMKCRVPRTKQEIEADCLRRDLTAQFRKQLNKLPTEDLSFLKSLEKVRETFELEEERRKRGSWDSLLEDGQDMTAKRKLRKLLRLFRFKKKKKRRMLREGTPMRSSPGTDTINIIVNLENQAILEGAIPPRY
ncbi:transmembrane inner ear expressed protein [Galendromus occidentalis]|uniref:Transmembrane inner ear expressed protein n=1 Tax=Galendromus occidentalis TaxID=34638 RepID=A0AAJ7SDL5_9ACAR|nr:transmembrane inner ear expressed protein [Galendromus occidentalis]